MSTTIIGVDPSYVSTGVCIYLSEPLLSDCMSKVFRVRTSPRNIEAYRLRYIYEKLMYTIHKYKPEFGVIEGPVFARSQSSYKLSMVQGIVRLAFARNSVAYVDIPPKALKRVFTGSGKASKSEMIERAKSLSGIKKINDDEADAFALAWIGGMYNRYGGELAQEVFSKYYVNFGK